MLAWDELAPLPLGRVPLAFVDVETTGLRAASGDRVCEIGVAVYRGDELIAVVDTLVNPCRPISPGATAVNGLRDEDVRHAPTFAEVAGRVAEVLALGVPVAHNAPFDLSFLAREFALAGLPPAAPGAVDTLSLARRLLPFGRHGLSHLAAALSLPSPGQAHRALADALTTRHLLKRLACAAFRGEEPSLGHLLALQGGPSAWPTVSEPALPPLPPRLAELIRPGQRLRLTYIGAGGERTVREVEAGEVFASGDLLYLSAFCHLRGEQRIFRLDRVVACEPIA